MTGLVRIAAIQSKFSNIVDSSRVEVDA